MRLLTFGMQSRLLREQKDFDSMDDDEFDVLIDMYSQDENVINEAKTLESGEYLLDILSRMKRSQMQQNFLWVAVQSA